MIPKEINQIFRKLYKQKTFTSINIIGLSLGLFFAILAFLYAQNEFKYDKHFTNTDDVYLMACSNGRDQSLHFGQPNIFSNEIEKNIPEVVQKVSLQYSAENLKVNNQRFKVNNLIFADTEFFDFFGWKLVAGNYKSALSSPLSVTISESRALELFKDTDPMGKIVNIGNEFDFIITGVFKDFPEQSHISTDFIASISSYEKINPNFFNSWGWHSNSCYFKLSSPDHIETTQNKIVNLWNEKSLDIPCTGPHVKAILLPFNQVYLRGGQVVGVISNMSYVIGFSVIAAFILLISCFNFINLTIAIQSKHAIENGIKKILGTNLAIISRHVFIEITTYLLSAIIISLCIVHFSISSVNELIGRSISLSIIDNYMLIIFIVLLSMVLLVICGALPVIQKYKAKTVGRLKRTNIFASQKMSSVKSQQLFKNSLVIIQFVIGIVLVIASLTVNQQLKLIRQHDAGFNKQQVLIIDNFEGDQKSKYKALSNLLAKYPEIKMVSSGSNVPFDGVSNWGGPNVVGSAPIQLQGCGFLSVDHNYFKTIGAKISNGRDFKEGSVLDKDKIIISETLAKALHLEEPIGVFLNELWDSKAREIVGVVDDIEYTTLHNKSLPLVFFCQRENPIGFHQRILVKIKSDNLPATLNIISNHWQEISPDYPLDYFFLDDRFNSNYAKEMQTASMLNIMTMVAILLCCMGLFGLALFNINARIKEIGIRKVNGAKQFEIIQLLNIGFAKWVVLAFIIASPLAYYVMNNWLQTFAYKTSLSWSIFALSGLAALGIALITVSWQTYRAARRNPVESLRYE